ncbi:hypothetical protein CYMTET_10173 [Cymbomonas tetramitiformis]|uniref:Uncharacterized protein n=1 Tax=Cymbomonas tetramitiformis TaxID=36881 RepID=A0AAE0GQ67_9CHLO|nr:hypothetical protein CYMTET_10173 [Cymbomonas tetramitiformis]
MAMKEYWAHLSVMNNDWNPQLKWPEAMNALQPGNCHAWKKKYGRMVPLPKELSKDKPLFRSVLLPAATDGG